MKDFIILCKAVYGSSFGANIVKGRKQARKYTFFSSQFFGTIFSGLLIALIFGLNYWTKCQKMAEAGIGEEVLQQYLSITIISDMIAVIGLTSTYIIGVFFNSKNDDILLPLPIKATHLFLVRLVIAMIFGTVYSAVFLVQGLIFVAFFSPTVISYINIIVISLTLPLLSVFVSFLIVNILGTIMKIRKHGWVKTVLGVAFGIVSGLLLMAVEMAGSGDTAADISNQITGEYKFLSFMNWLSYIPKKATMAVGNDGYYIFIYLLIVLLLFGLSIFSANTLYLKNIGSQEGKKKKKLSQEKMTDKIHKSFAGYSSNSVFDLSAREFKQLMHSPMMAIYAVVFTPMFAIIYAASFGAVFSQFGSQIPSTFLVYLIISGLVMFTVFMPFSSMIGISKEGRNIAVLKAIPLEKNSFIDSKIAYGTVSGWIISFASYIFYVLIGRFDPWLILWLSIGTFMVIPLLNMIALWADIKTVKFTWNSESELLHNTAKPILAMVCSLAVVILSVGISACFFFVPSYLIFIIPLASLVIFSLLFIFMRAHTQKCFDKMMNRDIIY
jgi:hypothetical protein